MKQKLKNDIQHFRNYITDDRKLSKNLKKLKSESQ